jgi:hypothetical protein
MLVHGERNCGIMLSGCDEVKQYGSEMQRMWWVHLARFGNNISVGFAKNWFDKFGRESLAKWLYFTVPHLSLRTARTMLVKKKNARSPCGLRADLLNFTIKKTIILIY